mgnify:CR=1 FL=1
MPKPELLETFPNPYADRPYEIHMICPEFTSLCPLGGIEAALRAHGVPVGLGGVHRAVAVVAQAL